VVLHALAGVAHHLLQRRPPGDEVGHGRAHDAVGAGDGGHVAVVLAQARFDLPRGQHGHLF
jgi:hypothetical protein